MHQYLVLRSRFLRNHERATRDAIVSPGTVSADKIVSGTHGTAMETYRTVDEANLAHHAVGTGGSPLQNSGSNLSLPRRGPPSQPPPYHSPSSPEPRTDSPSHPDPSKVHRVLLLGFHGMEGGPAQGLPGISPPYCEKKLAA